MSKTNNRNCLEETEHDLQFLTYKLQQTWPALKGTKLSGIPFRTVFSDTVS